MLLLVFVVFAAPARADIINLTAADNGKQIQATQGDVIVVRLPTANARYGWRLTQNYPGLLTVTRNLVLPGLSSGVPGAPATHEIQLQTLGTGGVDLTFISAVPGAGYSPLGDFFHVYLTIDKPGVAKRVNITEYGNHSRVTVNQGDDLQIKLGTTAGSSMRWEVMPINDGVVELINPEEKPSKKRPKKAKPGTPEDVAFNFRALKPGHSTVRFLYRDSAQPDAAPARDFELQIDVPVPPR
ncbi:hypothetical protein B0919_18365 [Hymenobacter sp. CRA2]|nr:hypothetical protein B0919_18365 [Hymenobacter sp. CRA2]